MVSTFPESLRVAHKIEARIYFECLQYEKFRIWALHTKQLSVSTLQLQNWSSAFWKFQNRIKQSLIHVVFIKTFISRVNFDWCIFLSMDTAIYSETLIFMILTSETLIFKNISIWKQCLNKIIQDWMRTIFEVRHRGLLRKWESSRKTKHDGEG